jgi:hypothetical protein
MANLRQFLHNNHEAVLVFNARRAQVADASTYAKRRYRVTDPQVAWGFRTGNNAAGRDITPPTRDFYIFAKEEVALRSPEDVLLDSIFGKED